MSNHHGERSEFTLMQWRVWALCVSRGGPLGIEGEGEAVGNALEEEGTELGRVDIPPRRAVRGGGGVGIGEAAPDDEELVVEVLWKRGGGCKGGERRDERREERREERRGERREEERGDEEIVVGPVNEG
jgi:hypothetical protein